MSNCFNAEKTCWNCPAAIIKNNVGFRPYGQSRASIKAKLGQEGQITIECSRRPDLGNFEPTITFEQCLEWIEGKYGYQLRNMRVMILGIDGYLGWALALKLGKLGFEVSGIDNYTRRDTVMEKGAHSIMPIARMTDRLHAAKEVLDIEIDFRRMDIRKRDKLREFIDEVKPEAIVHYGEIPSAPYSMVSMNHAIEVQDNNTLGTLGLLWIMKDIIPETSLIKLGTMGEYGVPLSGRPIFEGIFPTDATLKWRGHEWTLGGEMTPRDPVSFYHVSKVQDTFNVHGACKYWNLRSVDVQQGIIYGVHTDEVIVDPRLRTRFDIDEWFGTVVNRFVAQAIAGIPLTIYGTGEQIKGFIALEDAMECMVRLIISPPELGQYDVVNQVSGLYKLNDTAEIIAAVANEKYHLNAEIQRIENPRVETEIHPIEVISRKLPNEFGFKQKVPLEKEIDRIFDLLTHSEIKQRIMEKTNSIMPLTRWSGDKIKSDVIEKYRPGIKTYGEYKGKLDLN